MKYLIENLSFAQLSWLVVAAYLFHYLEEGPRLVKWLNEKYRGSPVTYTQTILNTENVIMFAVTLLSVLMLNLYPGVWFLQALALGWAFGLFGNTFFHCWPTLRTGVYSPGAITSAFFFPVTLAILVEKAVISGIFSLAMAGFMIGWGLTAYLALIVFTHKAVFRLKKQPPGP